MLQQLELQPISSISQDLSSSPLIRFYLQEECFTPQSSGLLELPFNQVVGEVVTEVTLASKFLSLNSRLNTNFLENGREIYNRKKQYFQGFLKEYELIRQTLVYLPQYMRQIIKYTVCALSNLILKLSINMAKISIVVISRILSPAYFNIFTVAILFEKYLGRQLLKVKQATRTPQQTKLFVRQFPRQTILKLSKKRNPYDFYYINKSQNAYSNQACNIQLLELFEEDEQIQEHFTVFELKRREKYNLQKLFGLKAPYGMELYLLFVEILLEKMAQFKPDVVIFIEDFDQDQVTIEPDIKGLIINEISTRIQNKIYILKEFGPNAKMMHQLYTDYNEEIPPQIPATLKQQIQKTQSTKSSSIIDAFINLYQDQTIPTIRTISIESSVKKNIYAHEKITSDFLNTQKQAFKNKKRFFVNKNSYQSTQVTGNTIIKQMRKNLFDDIANLSLSLIQKSCFQETIKRFRSYAFGEDFIQKLLVWVRGQKQKIDDSSKLFSDVSERLKNKIDRLNGMRQLNLKQSNNEKYSFYNLYLVQKQYPQICELNRQAQSLPIFQKDSVCVHYMQGFVMLFHFGAQKFSVFKRNYLEKYYSCLRSEQYASSPFLSARNSALIANKKYFYKAFGQFEGQLADRALICRISIEHLESLATQNWKIIQYSHTQADNQMTKVYLQPKIFGWAQSVEIESENWVLFGGGYNYTTGNQQRVSKCLYIIKNYSEQVLKVGKANSQLINQIQSSKLKLIIHPFVYGVPLQFTNSQLVVLNTNAYIQHLNHHKKLFLTKFKLPSKPSFNTLVSAVSQNKMTHDNPIEQSIANKNAILSWIHRGFQHINRYKGTACFYDSNGDPICLHLQQSGLFQKKDILIVEGKGQVIMSEQNLRMTLSFGCSRLNLRQDKKR